VGVCVCGVCCVWCVLYMCVVCVCVLCVCAFVCVCYPVSVVIVEVQEAYDTFVLVSPLLSLFCNRES